MGNFKKEILRTQWFVNHNRYNCHTRENLKLAVALTLATSFECRHHVTCSVTHQKSFNGWATVVLIYHVTPLVISHCLLPRHSGRPQELLHYINVVDNDSMNGTV